MRRFIVPVVLVMMCAASVSGQQQVVKVLTVQSAISPASMEYIIKAIREAEEDEAECLVIRLDTPGGLMTSMRSIIKEILGAEVPVVVYVAPSGAQSGSAGVFITYAAHIAAMAPGTNIGAASPVTLGGGSLDSLGTMEKKVTNDAAAYIRSLAQKYGRNADWGEDAVRNAVSVTENEALELNVIDLIADNVPDLLEKIDGREIELPLTTKKLRTADAVIEEIELGLRFKILGFISDPNIAYLLMLAGMYGILLELYNPGSIFPGVIGSISLILAFFALQTLPVNYAGLLLILLSVVLFIMEIKIVSYGLLSIGGVVTFVLGSIMLFDSPGSILSVSWKVIVPAAVLTALFFLVVIALGLKAQVRKPATGPEGLIGQIATVKTDIAPEGQVFLHGEIWKAESTETIKAGDKVEILSVGNLIVKVKKISGN
ncbi:nodulation protein NfeD [candidate division KSB1 bacterium]